MTEFRRHTVQEQPQCFVATLLAACFTLVGVLLATGSDVGGALPLAAAIEVAGFGRIKTGVAIFFGIDAMETLWGRGEHAW